MFGYIRPLKGELKVREFEQFKACYCALCHELKTKYGFPSRFILNYDLTFLAMLLWEDSCPVKYEMRTCPVSPFQKKCFCASSPALEKCAGYSIILSYWKLKDNLSDEGFIERQKSRAVLILLRRAYKRAAREHKEFAGVVEENLHKLSVLEKAKETSLDRMADRFALILAAAACEVQEPDSRRAMEQILYHTGRWIYIADAVNDLGEDLKAGRYNPVAARLELSSPELSEENKDMLRQTMNHSGNLIGAAFELTDRNQWSAIIRNILYLGMPDICAQVLNGTFKKLKEKHPGRLEI